MSPATVTTALVARSMRRTEKTSPMKRLLPSPTARVITGGEEERATFHTAKWVESAVYTSVPRTARSRSWSPSVLTPGLQSHRVGSVARRVPTRVVTLKGGVVLIDRIAQRSAMDRLLPESAAEKGPLKR